MLGDEGDEQGPLSKRRKLDPAEVEMILNAKSSHAWAAQEVCHVTSCDLSLPKMAF